MHLALISTNIADITTQAKCAAHPSCRGFVYIPAAAFCRYATSIEYVSACTIASSAVLIYRIYCCCESPWELEADEDCWIYSESAILLLLVTGGVPRL